MAQLSMNNNNNNSNNNEKNGYYQPAATPNVPPPAYPSAPAAPASGLATCSALYQYNAQDAGDLQLMPNDRVVITEYMNAEWWKGRNEKTGQEGIFPRSYVKIIEEKGPMMPSVPTHQPSNYGNMPQDVAHAGPSEQPGKGAEMGKKFGKKLGNAAVFGSTPGAHKCEVRLTDIQVPERLLGPRLSMASFDKRTGTFHMFGVPVGVGVDSVRRVLWAGVGLRDSYHVLLVSIELEKLLYLSMNLSCFQITWG
ncbi:SH3-domain-containing protein [Pseudovirgaria hyperparasitica]|uniref:SH3-domain-containing protein n=1 Tax=Pseudovirgaria hyperparasitica TaxID=470096 RepID=A0A6A6W582_9PEZI|nr:SH3-domain-containing protein [Pseudovirgaria hyperparasitica]KAF2757753.1 SH3-domain-containing protein [Pseudovirgaria hyperparasitica]